MNLIWHKKLTSSANLLAEGRTSEGFGVTRRRGGYSNYADIIKLERLGWIEARSVGPRGGQRWFTTRKGKINHTRALAATITGASK